MLGGWFLLVVAGVAGAGAVSNRLSVDFSLPGQPGYSAAKQIDRLYGSDSDDGVESVLVVRAPAGQTAVAAAGRVDTAFRGATAGLARVRIADYANTHDRAFVGSDGRTTVGLLITAPFTNFSDSAPGPSTVGRLRAALPGWQVGVTGLNQLADGSNSSGPGVFVETLIGAGGALVVLVFVFASLLALVPLLVAAASILTTLLLILALTTVTEVSFIVQFLVGLVGLGVSIDYSLLLVTRWREERERGADNAAAVIRAVETAGRTVAVSGLTVAIGLLALIVLPVPGLRSVGIGGVLIPIVSVAVVLTLLPALLGGIGPRVDWPRIRHEREASRVWSSWARLIVRRRWAGALIATALLALFIVPVFQLQTGETSVQALAKSGPAHDAYQTMTQGGISPGFITPIEVLSDAGQATTIRAAAAGAAGVTTATLVTDARWSRAGSADVLVIPDVVTVDSSSLEPVHAVRNAVGGLPGVRGITGIGSGQQDFSRAVYGTFPLMLGLIALATLILLTRAFKSLVLAVKAVILNLISLGATYGLLTFFWQEGHGSNLIFGINATGAITIWIPLMIFAFLFGLSMDYEVFILSRIREEHDNRVAGASNDTAIVTGLARTGRLVTSAALILFLAFASLASAPNTDLKVLATGLGVGILLDATIIRALLVPALMSLFGQWNWWLPTPVARILRIDLAPQPVPAP